MGRYTDRLHKRIDGRADKSSQYDARRLDYGRTTLKPDKGLRRGSCNRTACQAPGANWYNTSTRAFYCRTCAGMLNDWSARCGDPVFVFDLTNADPSAPLPEFPRVAGRP